jgi:hypothetical protein
MLTTTHSSTFKVYQLILGGFFNVSQYTIRHGAPNYRKIPYPENAKSQGFWTKLPIPAHPSNLPAVVLLAIHNCHYMLMLAAGQKW